MENKNMTLKSVIKTFAQSFDFSREEYTREEDNTKNTDINKRLYETTPPEQILAEQVHIEQEELTEQVDVESELVEQVDAESELAEQVDVESELVEQEAPIVVPKSIAYITIGQTINGSIVLSDDLVVEGVVNGDIDSSGNVIVRGKINGNVKGDNIDIDRAEVIGNIEAKSNLNMTNCNVIGNVIAEIVEVNGNIDGNIIAKELCSISENAVINGDISAASLIVKKNSKINGQINMTN